MNRKDMEKQIALYVEGDLPARKASAVEAHLAACSACRELADALATSQSALKSLRGETADPLLLDQVRSRVMAEIQTQQQALRPVFGWGWRFALAGILVALLAGGVYLWRTPRRQAPRRTEIVRVPETPSMPQVPPLAPAKPRRAQHRSKPARIAPEQQPTAASGPLVVKLFTDDPNVVILLVSENGG